MHFLKVFFVCYSFVSILVTCSWTDELGPMDPSEVTKLCVRKNGPPGKWRVMALGALPQRAQGRLRTVLGSCCAHKVRGSGQSRHRPLQTSVLEPSDGRLQLKWGPCGCRASCALGAGLRQVGPFRFFLLGEWKMYLGALPVSNA